MKKTIATALLLFLAGAPSAAQQPQPAKMSPLVRSAAAACHQPRRQAPPAKAHYINAFVCADPAKADSLLAANGCRKLDARGDIFIASIPTHRLNALSASPAVRRIEAARPCRAAMDTTASVINALPAYAGKGLPQTFTGRGVVVGVMDVGFDLTHPTFYDSTATTYRIGALWDMLDRDTIGSPLPVGRDYKGKGALLQKKHSTDGLMQTHGTHTLGIAAGSGHDSPYRGMAYESGICIVANAVGDNLPLVDSADVYKYTSATDALGFKYIFDYADSLGMPCVASFSEGATATYGTDDSLYCQYLRRLTGPGRIIVASAGNESVIARHVGKPAGKPQAGSFLCSGEGRAAMVVKADGPFCLRLLSYGFSPTDTVTVIDSPRMADSVFAVPLKLGGWYSGNLTATGVWMRHKDSDFYDIPFDRSRLLGVFSLRNDFHISRSPEITLSLNGQVQTKAIQGNYDLPAAGRVDAAVQLKFLKDRRATLKVYCYDMFETSHIDPYIRFKGQDFSMKMSSFRHVGVTFSYAFGGYKEKKHKEVDTSRFMK